MVDDVLARSRHRGPDRGSRISYAARRGALGSSKRRLHGGCARANLGSADRGCCELWFAPTLAVTMKFQSIKDVLEEATRLRERLEAVFSPKTAFGNSPSTIPSSGHCAAVSAIVFSQYGGSFVSAKVDEHSHWFNRLKVGGRWIDLDITGDQFG